MVSNYILDNRIPKFWHELIFKILSGLDERKHNLAGADAKNSRKSGECKSKEASLKQGRRTKKHSYAVVQVSENSGEKETEAGNAPSAMAQAKRSRQPSKKVVGNAEQYVLLDSKLQDSNREVQKLMPEQILMPDTPSRLGQPGSARLAPCWRPRGPRPNKTDVGGSKAKEEKQIESKQMESGMGSRTRKMSTH
eukprot:g77832.t1